MRWLVSNFSVGETQLRYFRGLWTQKSRSAFSIFKSDLCWFSMWSDSSSALDHVSMYCIYLCQMNYGRKVECSQWLWPPEEAPDWPRKIGSMYVRKSHDIPKWICMFKPSQFPCQRVTYTANHCSRRLIIILLFVSLCAYYSIRLNWAHLSRWAGNTQQCVALCSETVLMWMISITAVLSEKLCLFNWALSHASPFPPSRLQHMLLVPSPVSAQHCVHKLCAF